MYQGLSKLTLDAKGRISVPSRHRDALLAQCDGRITLTRHPDGCLLLYPRPRWEQKRTELARLAHSRRVLQRILIGSAVVAFVTSASLWQEERRGKKASAPSAADPG